MLRGRARGPSVTLEWPQPAAAIPFVLMVFAIVAVPSLFDIIYSACVTYVLCIVWFMGDLTVDGKVVDIWAIWFCSLICEFY